MSIYFYNTASTKVLDIFKEDIVINLIEKVV